MDQSPILVVPATIERWLDIEQLFANIPCWCQSWRLSSSEYGRLKEGQQHAQWIAERKEGLRRQLEAPTPPGVLAYLGDNLVGWCGLGPRASMERLVRSRTIPTVDDLPV